jgi:hypothetical protein
LDLPRAQALMAYWRAHPPTHQLLGYIAEGIGAWKPPADASKAAPAGADMPFGFLQDALAAGGLFTGSTSTTDPTQG